MKKNYAAFFHAAAYVLLGFLASPMLSADRADAALPTHVTSRIAVMERAFPNMHVLLVTDDANRLRERQRIRQYMRNYDISPDVIADDDELNQIFHDKDATMEPANWVLDDNPANTVCLITLDRGDYSRESGSYWKRSWDVHEAGLNLSLDPVQVGNWNINHELYHCITAHLQLYPRPALPHGMLEQLYFETSADTFAALVHLQQTNDRSLIQATADVREIYAGEDTEHFSAAALQYIVHHPQYSQATLRGQTPAQLAHLAYRIVNSIWPTLSRQALAVARDEHTGSRLNKLAYSSLKHMEGRQKMVGD